MRDLAAAQHASDDVQLLAHPFELVRGFGGFRDVVTNAQLQLERGGQILVARVDVWVFDDGERLREALTVDGKPNAVFSRQGHGADFGFANAPVENLAQIAAAEAALLPDVRIFRRGGAQQDQLRWIVEEVPDGTVHARAARSIELANDGAGRIKNLDLWSSLGGSFQGIGDGRAAVREKAIRFMRGKETHGNVLGFLGRLFEWGDVV